MERRRASGPLPRFLFSQLKRKKSVFFFEDLVDWEFKGCVAGLPWKNGIWVCKGEARGEVWMDTLPLWVGGY